VNVVRNEVRHGVYLDSVALMRIAHALEQRAGVERAALMIGTAANKDLLEEAGLLDAEGRRAEAGDLVIAVAAHNVAAAEVALEAAAVLVEERRGASGTIARRPRSLAVALGLLPDANLALVSVPGAFAAAEARAALRRGLDVMIFSDNVALEDEVALKREAQAKGRLVMGPDCGTALVAGAPLGFCNVVPRGEIGIIGASGTGIQEVMGLLARLGRGVSHALGTGGRDLGEAVGGLGMMAALDLLEHDAGTRHVVLVSKPPAPGPAQRLFERIGRSHKHFTVCFLGLEAATLPGNASFAPTLRAAAEHAAGARLPAAAPVMRSQGVVRGLFAGGTLCQEAQLVLRRGGLEVASNAPAPWVERRGAGEGNLLLDLGAEELTQGRPHPMIEPAIRTAALEAALADPAVGVVLLDLVLGWGSHADPAGAVVEALRHAKRRPLVIASVCGTDEDPQDRAAQAAALAAAGVVVAPSNAQAAELALSAVK
jgi:FdrA protein